MNGLDSWIQGDGLCTYCGQQVCQCPIDDEDDDETCCECGGEGFIVADCFEDTCCCADPELEHGLIVCPTCRNEGKP